MNYKLRYFFLSVSLLSFGVSAKKMSFIPHCEGVDQKSAESDGALKRILLDAEKLIGKFKKGVFRLTKNDYKKMLDKCSILLQDPFPSVVGIPDKGSVASVGSIEDHQEYLKALERGKTIKRDPNKTLLIFFHGTGSNPVDRPEVFRHSELLTQLRDEVIQQGYEEYKDFISVHGVGSGNKHVTRLHDSFTYDDSYSFARGSVTGGGTKENIRHALMHLNGKTANPAMEEKMTALIPHLLSVGRVVVVGWSRGAVTTIQFARDLFKDTELGIPDIKVNLFLIDPVPGFGNISSGSWKSIFHLYPNVESSVAVYAADEFSSGFTPVVAREVDKKGNPSKKISRQVVLKMPGNHATLVGNYHYKDQTKGEEEVFGSSARIVSALAQTFITKYTGMLPGVRYFATSHEFLSPDRVRGEMLQDFDLLLAELNSKDNRFADLRREGYLGKTQSFGSERKIHEEWELGFRALTAAGRVLLPRSTAKDLKGFYIKNNFDENKNRIYVNHLDASMRLLGTSFDLESIFNASSYYETFEAAIANQ